MTDRTTVGWSLVTSGIVTLSLAYLPGDSVYWSVGLLGSIESPDGVGISESHTV
ncbi:hypothetical protein SAMN05216388_104428 [Halorientalis persicus]|uniref:Uncharacterized protein n=1 Tax=Halorientalis persicus TaxID=1367881 RepID=A0A1H8VYZ7_9EURY|nr:hypothetical protein [Halorientalis persicus]SEP20619.1 hypothetical protein SAMN05216388_104428 [Halorientalis persicus]